MPRIRQTAIACALASATLLEAQTAPPQAPPASQGSAADQEPQQPVFRTRLESVAVPVSVFDPDGDLVTKLTRDDFTLFDNGQRMTVTTFSSGLQPLSAVALVDISASMMPAIDEAMSAAEQFIIRMRPGDRARVGFFSSRTWMYPEFTENRDALLSWLHHDLPFNNPTKIFDAVDEAIGRLLPEQGRRVVMLFTDGCDTASATGWSRMLARSRAEDVMVYAIMFHPRLIVKPPEQQTMSFGYQGAGPSGMRDSRQGMGPCTLHHFLELKSGTPLKDSWKADDPRWTQGPALIDQLASETGGGRIHVLPDEEMNRLFTAIMNELHYSYLLSFTPPSLDGKVHEITVRVNDNKLVVRARQHYLAPQPPGVVKGRS
jgi:VWFA-related protein